MRDADGNFLEGGSSYQLHLPRNIPAANFWSVTMYDSINASGLQNGRPLPSLNSMDKPVQNADGPYELCFGPNARTVKQLYPKGRIWRELSQAPASQHKHTWPTRSHLRHAALSW
jgi:hypothetical protein